jgi:Zn-dependent protease with chaperone function
MIKLLQLSIACSIVIVNFFALTIPFLVIAIVVYSTFLTNYIETQSFNDVIKKFVIIAGFLSSGLMLLYYCFDFIFGFLIKSNLKNCYKADKKHPQLQQIFNEAKEKFGISNAKIFIMKSKDINAFALGSFGRNIVIITQGLLNHYTNNCRNTQEFIANIKGIVGHEVSHLVNKDYLAGAILIINKRVNVGLERLVSNIFYKILAIFAKFGFAGTLINLFFKAIHKTLIYYIKVINFIIAKIQKFIFLILGRSVEYRCDRQSSEAFGGYGMASALEKLGKDSYFNLFSSHPKNKNRIKRVIKIKEKKYVNTGFFSYVLNYLTFIILILLTAFFYEKLPILFKEPLNNLSDYMSSFTTLFH